MAYDKVVDSAQLDAGMTEVAQAIRAKGGTTAQLAWPDGFKAAVESIETGITPTGSVEISENGTYDVTEKAMAVVNVLNNHLRFVYNNPSQVSGLGNYVTIVAADETLKQVRSLDSLIVTYTAQGAAECTKTGCLWNTSASAVMISAGTFGVTKRLNSTGEDSNSPQGFRADDDSNITAGSGRIYITEDGDLRIYGNTTSYPIRAGEIVVDVLW